MPRSKLATCVVTPSRLASIIEWKSKTSLIMGLEVSHERIGISVAQHPSPDNYVRQLDTIPYLGHNIRSHGERLEQKERIHSEIEDIIKKNGVAGFVVGWPLQPNGRPGASCGRVLHLLDFLAEKSNPIFTRSRPIVLWDERDMTHNTFEESVMPQDEWGRSAVFCRTPSYSKTNNVYSSHQQYYHSTSKDSTAARLLLQQFIDSHWEPLSEDDVDVVVSDNEDYRYIIDNHDSCGEYIQPSLL